jgi:hypothetical protein
LSKGSSDLPRSSHASEFERESFEPRLNIDEIKDNIERGTTYSKGNFQSPVTRSDFHRDKKPTVYDEILIADEMIS